MAEKKKGGRPTSDVAAARAWDGVSNSIKVRVPKLVEQALKRMEGILNDEKAADSSILRAAAQTMDLYHKMKAEEAADFEEEDEELANAEGLAAALALPKSNAPSISLVAFTPPEQKQG